MAKKLNTSGIPVDAPTTLPRERSPLVPNEGQGQNPGFYDELPTRPITGPPGAPRGGAGSIGPEPHTVIAGGLPRSPATDPQSAMHDPVVGWLVVVEGPGKGSAVQIGNGQNTIGRDDTRIRLDFGDAQISRSEHAVISYDPRANQFYIHQGKGVNLVYLEGSPVLTPTLLEHGSTISIGGTTLRFVAFCDDKFRWKDAEGTAEGS